MDKWEYQNKPYYLEIRVVREPCKRRTAYAYFEKVGISIALTFWEFL